VQFLESEVVPAQVDGDQLILLAGTLVIPVAELLAAARPVNGDHVFVSGSLVEGIGNITSDVDVHIVCERRPPAEGAAGSRMHRCLTRDREIIRSADEAASDIFSPQGLLLDGGLPLRNSGLTTGYFDLFPADENGASNRGRAGDQSGKGLPREARPPNVSRDVVEHGPSAS
jgi:hypothetical protein